MARQEFPVTRFGRVFVGGESNSQTASMSLNARIEGGDLFPRYGFRNMAASPVSNPNDFTCLGFEYVRGYNASYAFQEEWLSFERRSTAYKPYSVNPSTGARTEITNGASAVTLENVQHIAFAFDGVAYVVAPTGTVTLYKHEIGVNTSFQIVQNSAYTPAPSDPELTITVGNPQDIALHDAGDTYTYTSNDTFPSGTVTDSFSAEGDLELSGPSNDASQFGGYFQVQQEFASAKDISGADYFYVTIEAGPYLRYFTQTTQLPEFKIGGVWVSVTDAKFFFTGSDVGERNFSNSPARTATWVIYARGMTLTAVQGVRYRFNCKPNRGGTSPSHFDFATVSPLRQGGYYLEQDGSTKRLWDSTLVGDGVTYGIRFTDGGSTVSSIKQRTITAEQAQGYDASTFSCPAGAIIRLESSAPVSPYDRTQFLRLDESVSPAEWKELGTVTSAPFYFQDKKIETEIPGLSTITTGTAPAPVPSFTTQGIKGGIPYKGWVIWLFRGGKTNVRHSRVGDPEELRSTEATYSSDDLTQPADYSLADDFADEPVGGIQAGNVVIIYGQRASYSQYGNAPIQMTPCRQVPGSNGVAGIHAYARYKTADGETGGVHVDPAGNVWFIGERSVFAEDATTRPIELSATIRGLVKTFLLDEQRAEFGYTDLSGVHVQVDEADGNIWLILGKRALVYRRYDAVSGEGGWEPYEFQLQVPEGVSTVSACSDWSSRDGVASAVTRSGATDAFTNVGNAYLSDNGYATSGPLTVGDKTGILRVDTIKPAVDIPADATITSVKFRLERSKTGGAQSVEVLQDLIQPRLSGANWGANLGDNAIVTETDTFVEFTKSTALPTVSQINSGLLGLDIGFTANPSNPDANNPANWSFSVSSSGTTNTTGAPGATVTNAKVVTATYIGPGSPPDHVWVSLASTTTVGPTYIGTPPTPAANYSGTATADNGLDTTATGQIEAPTIDYPGSITASGSKIVRINLTAGTGTYTVNQQGSMSVSGTGFDAINVSGSVTPTFTPWANATVRVDTVEMRICYEVTETVDPGAVDIRGVAFSPDGRLRWQRKTGHIDELWRDSSNGNAYIQGTMRDGGYAMPSGYWRSQSIRGQSALRLTHVFTDKANTDTLTIRGYADDASSDQVAAAGTRNVRFGTNAVGREIKIELRFTESLQEVTEMLGELTILSKQRSN